MAFAALGVVLNTIVDALAPVADFLFKAFTEPQAAVETLRTRLTEFLGDYLRHLAGYCLQPDSKGPAPTFSEDSYRLRSAPRSSWRRCNRFPRSPFREVDDELASLTQQQEENKDALAKAPLRLHRKPLKPTSIAQTTL